MKVIISLLLISLMVSCNSENKQMDGQVTDIIKLSTHSVSFESQSGKRTVETEGQHWTLESFCESETYKCISIIEDNGNLSEGFTYDWISIRRVSNRAMEVSVLENKGIARKIVVCISMGDFFDYLLIEQKENVVQ